MNVRKLTLTTSSLEKVPVSLMQNGPKRIARSRPFFFFLFLVHVLVLSVPTSTSFSVFLRVLVFFTSCPVEKGSPKQKKQKEERTDKAVPCTRCTLNLKLY